MIFFPHNIFNNAFHSGTLRINQFSVLYRKLYEIWRNVNCKIKILEEIGGKLRL